jgi:hypothetical protein
MKEILAAVAIATPEIREVQGESSFIWHRRQVYSYASSGGCEVNTAAGADDNRTASSDALDGGTLLLDELEAGSAVVWSTPKR